jgi:hypothetical protein
MTVIVNVHANPAASVAGAVGQSSVSLKARLSIPISEIVNGAVPEFVSVTVSGALTVPAGTVPKFTLVRLSVTAGAVPLPLRLAVCGLPAALSVTDSVALLGPVAVGV